MSHINIMHQDEESKQLCVHVLCKLQGECIENTVNIQLARIKVGSGFDLDNVKLNVAFPGIFAVWLSAFHVTVEIIWIIHDNQESKVNFLMNHTETENRKIHPGFTFLLMCNCRRTNYWFSFFSVQCLWFFFHCFQISFSIKMSMWVLIF